jgi:hypothetical protein
MHLIHPENEMGSTVKAGQAAALVLASTVNSNEGRTECLLKMSRVKTQRKRLPLTLSLYSTHPFS